VKAGPDGGSVWQARRDLTPDGTPRPAAPATDAPAAVVDGKLVIGEGDNRFELSPDDVKMLMTQKAENDLRATRVPLDATGYKPELPKDLKLPPGVGEIKIDEGDPALADLRMFAHSRGWSQDDFSAALGIYAGKEARETAALHAAARRRGAETRTQRRVARPRAGAMDPRASR
jgi:hypothetical protein